MNKYTKCLKSKLLNGDLIPLGLQEHNQFKSNVRYALSGIRLSSNFHWKLSMPFFSFSFKIDYFLVKIDSNGYLISLFEIPTDYLFTIKDCKRVVETDGC